MALESFIGSGGSVNPQQRAGNFSGSFSDFTNSMNQDAKDSFYRMQAFTKETLDTYRANLLATNVKDANYSDSIAKAKLVGVIQSQGMPGQNPSAVFESMFPSGAPSSSYVSQMYREARELEISTVANDVRRVSGAYSNRDILTPRRPLGELGITPEYQMHLESGMKSLGKENIWQLSGQELGNLSTSYVAQRQGNAGFDISHINNDLKELGNATKQASDGLRNFAIYMGSVIGLGQSMKSGSMTGTVMSGMGIVGSLVSDWNATNKSGMSMIEEFREKSTLGQSVNAVPLQGELGSTGDALLLKAMRFLGPKVAAAFAGTAALGTDFLNEQARRWAPLDTIGLRNQAFGGMSFGLGNLGGMLHTVAAESGVSQQDLAGMSQSYLAAGYGGISATRMREMANLRYANPELFQQAGSIAFNDAYGATPLAEYVNREIAAGRSGYNAAGQVQAQQALTTMFLPTQRGSVSYGRDVANQLSSTGILASQIPQIAGGIKGGIQGALGDFNKTASLYALGLNYSDILQSDRGTAKLLQQIGTPGSQAYEFLTNITSGNPFLNKYEAAKQYFLQTGQYDEATASVMAEKFAPSEAKKAIISGKSATLAEQISGVSSSREIEIGKSDAILNLNQALKGMSKEAMLAVEAVNTLRKVFAGLYADAAKGPLNLGGKGSVQDQINQGATAGELFLKNKSNNKIKITPKKKYGEW